MTQLLKTNPKYRKGAIYYHIREKCNSTYDCKWSCDPPIEFLKPDPKESYKKIGKYKTFDLSNYSVSKMGNVINTEKNILLRPTLNKKNYWKISLSCRKTNKRISISLHKLVARVYITNSDLRNQTQVNHIDKNRSNNYYKNLEWVTPQYNCIHAHGKMVKMLDPDTEEILNVFKCAKDASRYLDKSNAAHIGNVCNNTPGFMTCFGYKWAWVQPGEILNKPIITIPLEKYSKK